MSPTETARIAPMFGARELRVYRFEPDEPGEKPDGTVWVNMSAECVSARCQLSPAEACRVALGLLLAAAVAEPADVPATPSRSWYDAMVAKAGAHGAAA